MKMYASACRKESKREIAGGIWEFGHRSEMNGIEVNELIPFAVNHCDEPILSFSKASGWRVVHATLVWYPSQLCCGVMFMPNTPPSWYPQTTQSFLDWDIMLTVLAITLSDHIKIGPAGVSPLVSLPMLGQH